MRERKKTTKPSKPNSFSKASKYGSNVKSNVSASYNIFIIALVSVGILLAFFIYNYYSSLSQPHDLLIIINDNGAIYTMDENMPNCKAICVDVTTAKFVYVSQNKDKLFNKCLQIPHNTVRAINASKYMLLPGLIDSHAHIMFRGALLSDTIDISQAQSFENTIQIIKEFISKHNIQKGEWIKAMGFDENSWNDWNAKGQPSRFDLDQYLSEYKLVLYRIDLHAVLVNTLALNSIKHTFPPNVDDINGGKVVKNALGEVTGLFIDNAKRLVTKHIHPYYGQQKDKSKNKQYIKMLISVMKECNRYGLTGVHDMDEQKDIIENVYKYVIDRERDLFTLRLSVYVHGSSDNDDENFRSDLYEPGDYNKYFMYGDRLSVPGVKLFLDGALGSYGAKLLDPYCDRIETDGLWIYNRIDDYYNDIKKWYSAGWQISTHAIGDRANRVALDMYQKLIKEYEIDKQYISDLRLRIEHAQIVEPIHDLRRFGELSIVANMQPAHATSDLEFAEKRLKCRNKNKHNRMLGAYAWKSMLKNNVKLTFGSDFPAVGQVNPFLGIYAAVTRKTKMGYPEPDGWYPNEKVSMMEALKAYTINAAYASFQEEFIGSITPNKLADFILIDRDLFQLNEKTVDILQTNVVSTFFGGKMVFHNSSFPIEYIPI